MQTPIRTVVGYLSTTPFPSFNFSSLFLSAHGTLHIAGFQGADSCRIKSECSSIIGIYEQILKHFS